MFKFLNTFDVGDVGYPQGKLRHYKHEFYRHDDLSRALQLQRVSAGLYKIYISYLQVAWGYVSAWCYLTWKLNLLIVLFSRIKRRINRFNLPIDWHANPNPGDLKLSASDS